MNRLIYIISLLISLQIIHYSRKMPKLNSFINVELVYYKGLRPVEYFIEQMI